MRVSGAEKRAGHFLAAAAVLCVVVVNKRQRSKNTGRRLREQSGGLLRRGSGGHGGGVASNDANTVEMQSTRLLDQQPSDTSILTNPVLQLAGADTVEEESSSDASRPLLHSFYRAIYAYDALNDDEMSLEVGDLVRVTSRNSDGWFEGRNARTKRAGCVPG